MPFESGPAGAVGYRYEEEEEYYWLSESAVCLPPSRGCPYTARLRRPGDGLAGSGAVDRPMLWLERVREGPLSPDVEYREVVDAVSVPEELATARVLLGEPTGVVALGRERQPDGWFPALAAWKADTRRWRLSPIDHKGLRVEDPGDPADKPIPRPELYAAIVEDRVREPPDVKRMQPRSVSTDWGDDGFVITHLHDISEGKDVLVVHGASDWRHTDTVTIPHSGDTELVFGLMVGGELQDDLIGLVAPDFDADQYDVLRRAFPHLARWPQTVVHAWRVTSKGKLEAVPVEGVTCRRVPEGEPGAGARCADSYSNLVALRGEP